MPAMPLWLDSSWCHASATTRALVSILRKDPTLDPTTDPTACCSAERPGWVHWWLNLNDDAMSRWRNKWKILFSDFSASITYKSTPNTTCTSFIGPLLYSHLWLADLDLWSLIIWNPSLGISGTFWWWRGPHSTKEVKTVAICLGLGGLLPQVPLTNSDMHRNNTHLSCVMYPSLMST